MGRLIFQNGSVPITISGILNNCSNDASVFEALMLNRLVDLQQLRRTVSEVRKRENRTTTVYL